MEISHKDITEFFNDKKHGTYHCPFCNSVNFIVNISGGDSIALLTIPVAPPPGILSAPQIHGFYSFSCTNCGHTTFLHQVQVQQWMVSKGKGKS